MIRIVVGLVIAVALLATGWGYVLEWIEDARGSPHEPPEGDT